MNIWQLFNLLIVFIVISCGNGGDKEKCPPGYVQLPDGTCVPVGSDADAWDGEDGEEISPEGEIEEAEISDLPELDGEEGEFVCERPCDPSDPNSCDDGNVCTREECAPITMCCVTYEDPNLTNGLPCGDDLYCNGIDYCYDLECYTEPLPPECDETNPCGASQCDEDNDMCYFTPYDDGTSCDDGLYCTGPDNVCQGGYCQYINPCPVDTGNPCTFYQCFEDEPHCRVQAKADGDPCPDSDPCNGTEFCEAGECTFVEPPCFDGDPCTEDVCVPETGDCNHPAINGCSSCSDPSVCDDGDVCTADYCRVVNGETQCERFRAHGCH